MTFMHVACIHSTVCLSVRESERFTKQDLSPGLGVWSQVLGGEGGGVGGMKGRRKRGWRETSLIIVKGVFYGPWSRTGLNKTPCHTAHPDSFLSTLKRFEV